MNDTILNLFPMSVMICEEKYKMTNDEKKFINNLEKEGNYNNKKSVSSYVLENKQLKLFKNYLQKKINHYMYNHLKYNENIEFYITQSWINYNDKDTWHHKHAHPNSILSGVYYVQGNAPIEFYRASSQFTFDFPCKEFVIENAGTWWVDIQPQDLILFSSTLQHSVRKNEKDETRISLAFNTFVKGKIGEENNLTETDIKHELKELDIFHI